MKKILVISWYFPPVNSSEGLVTFKLLKNSKYEYDVFTQKKSSNWAYNNTETKLISNNINTIFCDKKNINEWVKEGIEYYKKNQEKYDIVMTRSMAPESHEIGLEIKKINPNIKWIASFGDPIANNPYQQIYKTVSPYQVKGQGMLELGIKRILSPKRILLNWVWNYRNKKYIKYNTRIERDEVLQKEVFEYADKIIFNSTYQMNYMCENNKKVLEKGIVIPHTFDEEFYNKAQKRNDKIVISYVGHCDEIRTPKQFFEALTKLKEHDENLKDKLEVSFYGDLADRDKVLIIDNDLTEIVKVRKNVSYFESLDIMSNSNWLLLIDANLSTILDNNIFFAAKLADYLGSKTPIFGITMYNGPSADILRETNNIVSSFSVEEIYMNLRAILDGKIKGSNSNGEKYNAKKVAQDFDTMVENLIKDEK